jgi:predicted AlkP superfamily phosphohydrolase/phosphomutase
MASRTLVIGLDGADWRVLRPQIDAGVMPHLADLLEAGTSGNLRSPIPTNSAVAWPSFLTGRNAGKHGVFDFTLRAPDDATLLVPADSRSIRSETFPAALGRHGPRLPEARGQPPGPCGGEGGRRRGPPRAGPGVRGSQAGGQPRLAPAAV